MEELTMKARYIIISVLALAAAVSCQKEGAHLMSEFQADKLYVTIPEAGGKATINVTATESWTFDIDIPKDTTVRTAEKGKQKKTIEVNQLEEYPWVAISPAKGEAGKTTITFTDARAAEDVEPYTQTFKVKVGDKYQNIIVSVGTPPETPVVTVKQLVGDDPDFTPVAGKTYRITGSCSNIANTSYGNWYLKDETSDKSVYIYGTVDATGSYNWSSFGIEIGDKVTVEGPYTLYGTTTELVDASFIKVEKALLATKSTTVYIGKEATSFDLEMEQKGTGLGFESLTDWLTLDKAYTVNSKGNLVFKVTPTENTTGKSRTGSLFFTSTKTEKNKKGEDVTTKSEVTVTVIQQAEVTEGTLLDIRTQCGTSTSSKNPAVFDVKLTKPVTVTYVSGSYMFMEDGDCGLTFYNSADKYSVGQVISGRVFGTGYAYSGVAQGTAFNSSLGKAAKAPTDPTKLPKGTEITLQQLMDNWDTWAYRLVTIKELVVTEEGGIDATYPVSTGKDERHPAYDEKGKEIVDSGDIEGEVTDGTNKIAVRINSSESFYLKMAPGQKYNVTCIPTLSKGNKQLGLWEAGHIKEVN